VRSEKEEFARPDNGPWMLREAVKALGLPEEAVDELLRQKPRTIP
jgi:hypothetical protein